MFTILASETSKNGLTFSCYLVSTLDSLFFAHTSYYRPALELAMHDSDTFPPNKICNSK